MIDSKINKQYLNSRGEFVDIYAELRLPKGAESTDEEIKEAYRGLLKKYHPDVSKDVELALAMTQFANRAMEVLKDDRASYDARWRRIRGRKASPPPSTGASGGGSVPPPPNTGGTGSKNNEEEPPSGGRKPRARANVPHDCESPLEYLADVGGYAGWLVILCVLGKYGWKWKGEKIEEWMAYQQAQSVWYEVDASLQKAGSLEELKDLEKMKMELKSEIVQHRACAAYTIACQNGLKVGGSFYWLEGTCPPIKVKDTSESTYPNFLETSTDGHSYDPQYPNITPHPYVICWDKSDSEEVTFYRTFLSLEK